MGLYLFHWGLQSQGGARPWPFLHATLLATCSQGRPGEICIMGPKGQKVSCGFCGAESECQAEAAALSRPRHV